MGRVPDYASCEENVPAQAPGCAPYSGSFVAGVPAAIPHADI